MKTSILILDKSLARQSDTVAFFKVDNDGFGLGAQRRPIEKNDLPQVQAELTDYLQALRGLRPTEDMQPTSGLIVPKEKIAANGDYNLSGERYRELIERCYREFLLKSHDPDEREYSGANDQICETLIHANYMSQKDIAFCLLYDLKDLRGRAEFPNVETLHQELCAAYTDA